MEARTINSRSIQLIQSLDTKLSKRFISLDPMGYFLIKIDWKAGELVVEHFSNEIDNKGRALDPETGELIKCSSDVPRSPLKTWRGRSAKEIGIKLTEEESPSPLSRLDHALYLGRELQKAEGCLIKREKYIQD